ncbi:MAG: BPL-N domain-containing protein [Pseudomonadota bacterium]
MAKPKLSGYFLCAALLFFGKAWCADSLESPKISIKFTTFDAMKMEGMPLTVNLSIDASEDEKSREIATQFELYLRTDPVSKKGPVPGDYSYREDYVYNYIKNPSILFDLRDQLKQIWNKGPFRGRELHITEVKFPGTVVLEPVFEISSTRTIYLYYDKGVTDFSARICEEAIAALESRIYVTQRINAEQTIAGLWRRNAAAYLIPGGSDLSFCEKLNGAGNTQIKDYITTGGTYIGFCAGAYYGSRSVEFNKDSTVGDEVIAERELSFFPGSAVGPVLAPFTPTSKEGVRIANIKCPAKEASGEQLFNVYYNGGCHFKDADQHSTVSVLAHYNNPGFEVLAAIVKCQVGEGKALLSGVHPEYSTENLETLQDSLSGEVWDYMQENIIPTLSDGSHKKLFRMLIEQIYII